MECRITGHGGLGYDCNNQSQDKRGRLRRLHTTPPPINTNLHRQTCAVWELLTIRHLAVARPTQGLLAQFGTKTHQGQTCAVLLYGKNNKTSTKKIPQVNKIQSTVKAHYKTVVIELFAVGRN
ncbi:hypothetical protein FWK35_00017018 [Aphis craccivora]|uniref:Uncharacterized protein n=1 Tax=Aphis craccivora TaxID=307492 RepID=A0A6G0YYK4_APHCR|nr:hypothetical protein FWK35_00017018 [Aphis craccivora]